MNLPRSRAPYGSSRSSKTTERTTQQHTRLRSPRNSRRLQIEAAARSWERALYREHQIDPRQFYYNRVRSAIGAWRRIGASSQVLRWISQGVPILWHAGPLRPFHHGCTTLHGEARAWWRDVRLQYLRSGALRPARDPRFISRAFLIPKKDGGYRLCIDLRHLNAHCIGWHTKYETMAHFLPMLKPGMWMISFDVKDAFHHLKLEERFIKYVAFTINGETLEAPALSFGWCNLSPVFTKFMRPLVCFLRAPRSATTSCPPGDLGEYWVANHTPALNPYMDDFLGALLSRTTALRWSGLVQRVLGALQVTHKPTKSVWTPTQVLPHLGLLLDIAHGLVIAPPARVHAIKQDARLLLAQNRRSHPGRFPSIRLDDCGGGSRSTSCGLGVRAGGVIWPLGGAFLYCWDNGIRDPGENLTTIWTRLDVLLCIDFNV